MDKMQWKYIFKILLQLTTCSTFQFVSCTPAQVLKRKSENFHNIWRLCQEIGNVNKTQQPRGKFRFKGFQTQSPCSSALPKIVGAFSCMRNPILIVLALTLCCKGNDNTRSRWKSQSGNKMKSMLQGRERKDTIQHSDIVPRLLGYHTEATFWTFLVTSVKGREKNEWFWYDRNANTQLPTYISSKRNPLTMQGLEEQKTLWGWKRQFTRVLNFSLLKKSRWIVLLPLNLS